MGLVEGAPVRVDVERGADMIADEVSVSRRLRSGISIAASVVVVAWNLESQFPEL